MPSISIFQDTVATSSTGAILPTSLKARLTRRRDLRCTLKGAFDRMTDAIEPANRPVDAAWVIRTILEGSSRTRRAYVTRRHGAEVISLGNAAHDAGRRTTSTARSRLPCLPEMASSTAGGAR